MRPTSASASRFSWFLPTAATLLALACNETTTPPPVPTKLAFTAQPVTTSVNFNITPAVAVAVQDAAGNTITSANNSITLAIGANPGSGSLSGTTTVGAVNGVATFADLSINSMSTGYTLTATAPNLTGATSTAFNVTPGPATRLVFTVQPVTTSLGATITPAVAVTVQDLAGNTVTTATNSITVAIGTNAGSGTLLGTTTVLAVNGVATFSNLSINNAGAGYTLTATVPNLTGATSTAFNVTPGPATRLVFTAQPAIASPGATITPAVAVTVQDLVGNTVTTATNSITVAIGTNAGSGTLSGTTTVAAVNGVATFSNLSINNTGAGYTLTAAAANLSGATSTAFDVRNPLTFTTASAGYFHSCGVATGGAAYCWDVSPVAVSGGLTFAKVSAGRTHTCGVTTGGVAYCWGDNSLGDGTTAASTTPVPVSGGLTFASVSAGYSHSCGVTTAGVAYCWGLNANGELGNGTWTGSNVPGAVSGGLTFASVSPGRLFTCGLSTGGAAYCWGDNYNGMLGNGALTGSNVPGAVSGGLTFATVSAGGFHACGVTTAGVAYCWGWNYFGELGDGTTAIRSIPVAVSGGLTFAMISAGNRHTCGVTTGGAAYCWGDNSTGHLGDGTTIGSRSAPFAVSGGLTFASVSAGRFHSCGVTTANAAYCWGSGQLGSGTSAGSLVPVRVH